MIKSISAAAYAIDPSLLTLDILRCGSLRLGTDFSFEAIIAMVHQGVPADILVGMGEQSLEELRDAFIPRLLDGETEEDVINRIVANCFRRGGVSAERKKRHLDSAGKSTRIAGLGFDRSDREDTPEEVDDTVVIDS